MNFCKLNVEAEGMTSEDGESCYNGDPITDYETDCTTQDMAHSYFEFSFGEKTIPKYPPSSAFSEELENEDDEQTTSRRNINPDKSEEDPMKGISEKGLSPEALLHRAKQAFRPITPFDDSSDVNPSKKMDNLYSYLMHVEKRQIEMSKAWSLIKSCDLKEAHFSANDIKGLISSCKKFKEELKIRVDWLMDEVSKLQTQLQKLKPSKEETNNQKRVASSVYSFSHDDSTTSDIVLVKMIMISEFAFPNGTPGKYFLFIISDKSE